MRAALRAVLVLAICAALGLGLSACGGSHTTTVSARVLAAHARAAQAIVDEKQAERTWRERDRDDDNDVVAPDDDTHNNPSIDEFGPAAGSTDRRAITALVKRYYAAALAENGAQACSMIYSTLAESVAEDYGQNWSSAYLRGSKTCAAVLSRLFSHLHFQLAVEVPKLEVVEVRVNRNNGLAVLGFAGLPGRQLELKRERRTWRVEALLDSELQ